jgi:hypothetical protein
MGTPSPSAPPRPAAPSGFSGSGGTPSAQPYRPSWARDDDDL